MLALGGADFSRPSPIFLLAVFPIFGLVMAHDAPAKEWLSGLLPVV
jgi:hypothetical protein